MKIHPKASGAAFGSALGVVIVGILQSVHGLHLDPTLNAAIPALLSSFGAWAVPAPDAPSPEPTPVPAPAPTPVPVMDPQVPALKARIAELEKGQEGKG